MAKNRNTVVPKERDVLNSRQVKAAQKEADRAKMQIAVAEYREHSGPIPDPMTLKGYNDVCPGAANRIIVMAENQAKHRQEMEKTVVNSRSSDSKMGILCGFILALATIASGTYTISAGYVWSGAILGSAGPVGLVSAFIYGTRSNRKEREQKDNSAS